MQNLHEIINNIPESFDNPNNIAVVVIKNKTNTVQITLPPHSKKISSQPRIPCFLVVAEIDGSFELIGIITLDLNPQQSSEVKFYRPNKPTLQGMEMGNVLKVLRTFENQVDNMPNLPEAIKDAVITFIIQYSHQMNVMANMVERPIAHVEHPIAHVEHPIAHVEHPIAHVEHPIAHVEHPIAHVEHPIAHVEHPIMPLERSIMLLERPIAPPMQSSQIWTSQHTTMVLAMLFLVVVKVLFC